MITEFGLVLAAAGWTCTHLRAAKLQRRLRTDSLTGIGNRLALIRAAGRGIQGPHALFMLDLNEFKAINDTFGHQFGDRVLIAIARRLRAKQVRGHLAVRLSGDEFAFWISRATSGARLAELKDRLAAAIAEPMTIDGYTITVTASIGIAIGDGRVDLSELLTCADKGMYREKHLVEDECSSDRRRLRRKHPGSVGDPRDDHRGLQHPRAGSNRS